MAQHTINITVSNSGQFTYTTTTTPPDSPVGKDDRIKWTCGSGNFAVQFNGMSPTEKRKGKKPVGNDIDMQIRRDVGPGAYKYTVAVAVLAEVFIDDPEIIIDDV